MTREEAIKILKKWTVDRDFAIEAIALDMAIKALEQEPCEDVVSRKDVHDMLENLPVTVENKWFNWLQKACMRLAALPPVTLQPKTGYWIPISEKLPENESRVLVTIQTPMRTKVRSGMFENKRFYNDNGDTWKITDKEVKAWMPLPEPYEPQESEDKCKKCEYYINPDYTRCHTCKAESEE